MLQWTVTKKSPETDELHRTEQGQNLARCQADDQRRASRAEIRERTYCFTCTEDERLDQEDE